MRKRGTHTRNHKRNQPVSDQSKARIWAAMIRARMNAHENLQLIDFSDYDFYGDIHMTQLVLDELADLLEAPQEAPF